MSQESYTRGDIRKSFDVARSLLAAAMREVEGASGKEEGGQALAPALAAIDAAIGAFESADPMRAAEGLSEALRLVGAAREAARRRMPERAADADLSSDHLDQAFGAIGRVLHRVRNATSRRTAFGAIRTPPGERLP